VRRSVACHLDPFDELDQAWKIGRVTPESVQLRGRSLHSDAMLDLHGAARAHRRRRAGRQVSVRAARRRITRRAYVERVVDHTVPSRAPADQLCSHDRQQVSRHVAALQSIDPERSPGYDRDQALTVTDVLVGRDRHILVDAAHAAGLQYHVECSPYERNRLARVTRRALPRQCRRPAA
jgi:hypothetical protein